MVALRSSTPRTALEVSCKQKYKMRKWTESRNSTGAVVMVSVVVVIVRQLHLSSVSSFCLLFVCLYVL
jgi:hypothetical protein